MTESLQGIIYALVSTAVDAGTERSVPAIHKAVWMLMPQDREDDFKMSGSTKEMVRTALKSMFDVGIPIDERWNSKRIWKLWGDVSRNELIKVLVAKARLVGHITNSVTADAEAWIDTNPQFSMTIENIEAEVRKAM